MTRSKADEECSAFCGHSIEYMRRLIRERELLWKQAALHFATYEAYAAGDDVLLAEKAAEASVVSRELYRLRHSA